MLPTQSCSGDTARLLPELPPAATAALTGDSESRGSPRGWSRVGGTKAPGGERQPKESVSPELLGSGSRSPVPLRRDQPPRCRPRQLILPGFSAVEILKLGSGK